MRAFSPFVAWLGSTPFALWIGASTERIAWLFVIHLFGLVLLLGSITFVCLRLLNVSLREIPIERIARAAFPVITAGLVVMLASGLVIFAGGATSYFDGFVFRLKMVLLMVAVLFHFLVFRRVALAGAGRFGPIAYGGVAVCALLIWFSVACVGRAIAFF